MENVMKNRSPITADILSSGLKSNQEKYNEAWEVIFGKPTKKDEKEDEKEEGDAQQA